MKNIGLIMLFLIIISNATLFSQTKIVQLKTETTQANVANFSAYQPVNLIIDFSIDTQNNLLKRYDANPVFTPVVKPDINVERFIENQIQLFIEKNKIAISKQSQYILKILINKFEINYLSGNGWTGSVKIDISLRDKNKLYFEQTSLGFNKLMANHQDYQKGAYMLVKALTESINSANWRELMSHLKNGEQAIVQANKIKQEVKESNSNSLHKSNLEFHIPVSNQIRKYTFAVIIGNEQYTNEIDVEYAENDARVFHQYVTQALGVPEKQAHLVLNATYGKMLGELDWLTSVAKTFGKKATIIFYYAGHGMPDEQNRKPYLLPIDGNASQVRTAISTSEIYNTLTQHPTNRVLVFFDACFSGAARDGMLASGRGVRIKPRETDIQGNMIVFSAVSGEETAHPYDEESHGLFSYYLMKKIQETRGKVTLGELYNFIRQKVNQQSVINGKEQNPKVNVSPQIITEWENFNL